MQASFCEKVWISSPPSWVCDRDRRRCPRRARARSRSSRRPAGGCRAWRRAGRRRPRSCACRSSGSRIGSERSRTSPSIRARGNPLRARSCEQLPVLALAAPHDRREHLEPGALGQLHHLVDDLLGRLAPDRAAAVGAVRVADPGVQHPQVVVDLGDRADRRARVARGGLLVDRDGRREPLDEVDVGLLHLSQELPGVGRQRLHVAPLALGVDRVEGERGLPGAGQAREHDQLGRAGSSSVTFLRLCSRAPWMTRPLGAQRRASVEASADTPAPALSCAHGTRPARDPSVPRTSRRSSGRCWSPGSARSPTSSDPAPPPTGRWIAFTRSDASTARRTRRVGRICLVPSRRVGAAARSPTDPNDDAEPAWSPDGATLTFRSRPRGGGPASSSTRWRPTCSARPGRSPPCPGVVEHHRWSPDGSTILVVVAGDSAEQADALGSGTLGGQEPGRSGAAVAPRGGVLRRRRVERRCAVARGCRHRRGAADLAGRTSTSGKPPGAAPT